MPEGVLRGWRAWGLPCDRAPRVVRELMDGRTNRSYLIEADGQRWVLRLNAPNSRRLGIDRHREATILTAAATAGIAPTVAYCAAEHGLLITEFIDGRPLLREALHDPASVARLLSLIRRVHAIKVELPVIDFYAHAERYWQRLIDERFEPPNALLRERRSVTEQRDARLDVVDEVGLCHCDPTPKNVIERDGRLYLFDWEYAARGWSAFDYAAIAIEWDMPLARLQETTGLDQRQLRYAAALYRYTCRLWALINR
jgi:thiamine kinase